MTSASRMRRETSTAVEQDAVAFELRLEGDAGAGGEVHEGRLFVEGVVVLDGLEGEGAVHGSGFEVEEAEAAGEMGGEGAFAGAGGPVDGDDGALALLGRRLRGGLLGMSSWRLAHPADSLSSGLNLRAGGRLPKGFLLPLNLSKVLAGLPVRFGCLRRIWRRAFCRRSCCWIFLRSCRRICRRTSLRRSLPPDLP